MTAFADLSLNVLLVEDDPGDELLTREAFEETKSTLHVTRDGLDALDFLHRRNRHVGAPRPDLILLDINLPGYNGRQVLAQLKSDDDLSAIPVVMLTTSSAEEDIRDCYQLHASAYVTKPSDFDGFTSVIGKIEDFYSRLVRLPLNRRPEE